MEVVQHLETVTAQQAAAVEVATEKPPRELALRGRVTQVGLAPGPMGKEPEVAEVLVVQV